MSLQSHHVEHILDDLKGLPLTGKIISVLPTIPCAIGITHDCEIKVAPLPEKTSIQAFSTGIAASGWKHTIVAWTGEILPAESNAFKRLLKRSEKPLTTEEITQQFEDTHLARTKMQESSDYLKKLATSSPTPDRNVHIDPQLQIELAAILKDQFQGKVVPVWSTKVEEDGVKKTVSVKHTSLLRNTSSTMLYQTLFDGSYTAIDNSFSAKDYEEYERLNLNVAQAVVQTYQPGDIIWIHTHQHMLLPEMLRRRLPSALIIYAQNELWSSKETLSKLYNHHKLMAALLGADIVVAPTTDNYDDVTAYYKEEKQFTIGYAKELYPHHRCQFFEAPIGLDVPALRKAMGAEDVQAQVQKLESVYANKKVIFARARVDQLPGMMVVLSAFQHLLETTPEWIEKVVLIIVITPSRVPEYTIKGDFISTADLTKVITDIISQFGSPAYAPVICLIGYRPLTEYLAVLQVADIGIAVNNQIFANDMSREFVIAQETRCNPLLVATYSRQPPGEEKSSGEQGRLLLGQKYLDITLSTDAELRDVLTMVDWERRGREQNLLLHFTEPPVSHITTEVIVEMANNLLKKGSFQRARPLPMEAMLDAYNSARKRFIALDYDGTMTPIVNDPDAAIPTKCLLKDLRVLAGSTDTVVYIVSGRSREFLEQHFGSIEDLGLGAEHGSYVRKAGDPKGKWTDRSAGEDLSWREEVESTFEGLVSIFPGSWIERKEIALVWHYRMAADHESCLETAMQVKEKFEGKQYQHYDFAIMLGKANLEARPRFLGKGSLVTSLLSEDIFAKAKGDKFVFCAGDDTTDEDMFRAILSSVPGPQHCFTCHVGGENQSTIAQYRVDGPQNVVEIISDMA